ncbi:MAG: putative inorganic carbon transporter subunit DabA [Cyanobacteriota/Melainabacteria group bacterium]
MDALMTKESKIRADPAVSLVLSHYWPMTGFVHHNPIRSLETFRFHEAIEKAHRFTGGRGYLTNRQYRRLVESGRIEASHLDSALKAVSGDQRDRTGC